MTKCYPTWNSPRPWSDRRWSDHIESDYCSRLHSRDENPRGSSGCSRSGLRNSRYSRSSHPDRRKSLCSCHANGRPGLPFRRGSLPHNHGSLPAAAFSHRIRSSRSSDRHDCNDRLEPCRNTGRDHNRSARSGDVSAAGVGALNTVPENDTAPYVFVAVATRYAVLRGIPAAPDGDGTVPHVVAVD